MVFFESPHRTRATLAALASALGDDRPAAVCREPDQDLRGGRAARPPSLVAWVDEQEHGVRGEVTLVVAGHVAVAADLDDDALRSLVAAAESTGLSRKDAVAQVVADTGVRKRVVYDAAHAR